MSVRIRYTIDDVNNNRFYQMPKFLFEDEFKELSNDARVLYSLLKDKHELSLKNNWVNENNEVYLIFSRSKMGEILGLSDKTVKKAIDQLLKFDLIDEERLGQGKANLIYLKAVTINSTKTRRISDSELGENTILDSENFRSNDTNNSDTDYSDTIFLSPEDNEELNLVVDNFKDEIKKEDIKKPKEFNQILENSNYKDFEDKYSSAVLQAIRLLYYSNKPLRINNMLIPPSQVREDLKMLKWEHIDFALRDFKIQSKNQEILYPVAYLSRCIYNAIFQGDLRMKSELLYHDLL